MITPAYSPTATERVLPRMALDFTTGVLDSRVTIARALNTATRTNSSGALEIVNANLPRFDYDPTTLAPKGLLIEEARTNLFLNSLIDGTSLSTQTVAVTAIAYTISFYGTGTITLSGASTATVTGTGVYPNRKTLTFTPIVGALICTVTGSVQYAQIEAGAFATSFIPTAATSITRNADVVSMTGTNFSDWYNASEGAFAIWHRLIGYSSSNMLLTLTDSGATNLLQYYLVSPTSSFFLVRSSGVDQSALNTTVSSTTLNKTVGAYKTNDFAAASNGGVAATDASGTIPTVDRMGIGSRLGALVYNGHIQQISYWPQRLTTPEIRAFSK